MAIVEGLRGVAKRKNATPPQIALAWLLAQRPWIVPIPGMDKTNHIDENIGATEIELTPHDLAEVEAIYSRIPVQGARLSKEHMALLDR